MVALVLRLRLTQLTHALRRRPHELLGMAILLAVGLALTGYALEALGEIPALDAEGAATTGILIGSLITAAYLAAPIVAVADDPADPRSFGILGMRPLPIAGGLALSGLLSIPAVLLIIIAGAHSLAWVDRGAPVLVAVVSFVLIVATSVIGARLARSLASVIFMTRHLRELAGLLGLLAVLATLPFVLALALGLGGSAAADPLVGLAHSLGTSPLGFAWAAPARASEGDGGGAALSLLLALVFAGALWLLWQALVGRMLRSRPTADPYAETAGRGLGWFEVLPQTVAGAIAARSLTYWMRDGRYRLALAVIPVVSLIVIVPFFVVGVWWQNLALVPLPIACLFLGWILHNDLAHDNSALWLHIAANVSGWADRLGRAIPVIVLGLVVIAVLAPLSVLLYGDWSVFPSMIGVCLALLLGGIGASSYISARMPYAAVRPGASPFAQPQSSGSSAGQAVSLVLTVLVSLPAFAFAALGLADGGAWGLASLAAGVLCGVGALFAGIGLGARVFATRAPELLAFTLRN